MSINFKAAPFNLSDTDIVWVENTYNSMTLDEKIGQMFCFVGMQQTDEQLVQSLQRYHVGAFMYRPSLSADVIEKHRLLQSNSKIPLLLAANLESGGSGVAVDGTELGKPLQCSAMGMDPVESGYRLGKVACSEGAAVGCNWSFAPIVDIDLNYHNPITNLRTFGSAPDRVLQMATGYLKAARENNVGACIKHFPGDGVDERDQHLVTSVNSLSADEWDQTYGKVYKGLIAEGAMSVMVGHIAQPAKARQLIPGISAEDAHLPASLSPAMMTSLLREELKFNGVITTDSSTMLGMGTAMTREKAVPAAIAAGSDMLLFVRNPDEDFMFMKQGYENGTITAKRLEEAVKRILAMKAALGLHTKPVSELVPAENRIAELRHEHFDWCKECADQSITLVKNKENLLPLSPSKTKRIYLNVLEESDSMETPLRTKLKAMLEQEGFEVTVRDRNVTVDVEAIMRGEIPQAIANILIEQAQPISAWKNSYDLVLYVANYDTASNNTVIRLNWHGLAGAGNDYPWFVKEMPTVFVSLANPYHLLDAPMMKTFINAYSSTDITLTALIDKLVGRSDFVGISPVDPFCGMESLAL